jgi:hypothetical protein
MNKKAQIDEAIGLGNLANALRLVSEGIAEGENPMAANVPAIGTTANLVGVDGTLSNAAPLVGTESRLDAIEAKVDAVIAALKAANLMASS